MERAFEKGLQELGDGLYAYIQPDGSWGWSNAGLVAGSDRSLLVDTLFDLRLTREMLDAMDAITRTRPIGTLVNTHANGDHCFGNELLGGAEIITTEACASEMTEMGPQALDAMLKADYADPVVGEFVRGAFGAFRFDDITLTTPTRTFKQKLTLPVAEHSVELIEVGPAHTAGDLLAYVPQANTIFAGDILFIGGTPIIWAGPLQNWVNACDLMLELNVDTVVPGHGPVTDKDGVRDVKAYLEFVDREARQRFDDGMPARDAAHDIDLGEFADWSDSERLVVNVHAMYGEFDPAYQPPPIPELVVEMAHYAKG
jgi:glyoxylase-like metal-dependent hydrolase (beta-lactamase superfamily II)